MCVAFFGCRMCVCEPVTGVVVLLVGVCVWLLLLMEPLE